MIYNIGEYMNGKLSIIILMLVILTNSTSATSDSTFSPNLNDTEYTWEIVESNSDVYTIGTQFEIQLEEPLAGKTYTEYVTDVKLSLSVNGEQMDLKSGDGTVFGEFAIELLFFWAYPLEDFSTNDTQSDGTIKEIKTNIVYIYDENNGLLLEYTYDDGTTNWKLEKSEGFMNSISVKWEWIIIAVISGPILNKYSKAKKA